MVAAVSARVPEGTVVRAWTAFQERIRSVVRECNCVAGQEIWRLESSPDRMRVWGGGGNASSVELSLDVHDALLFCTYSRGERWKFQFRGDGETLRRSTETYSMAQAVDLILDRLVE